jgi:hypothetical protein
MPHPNQIMGHANYLRKGTFCLALKETFTTVRYQSENDKYGNHSVTCGSGSL